MSTSTVDPVVDDVVHDVDEEAEDEEEEEEVGEEEDTELRDLVTHVLQSTGILGKIKVGRGDDTLNLFTWLIVLTLFSGPTAFQRVSGPGRPGARHLRHLRQGQVGAVQEVAAVQRETQVRLHL